MMFDKIYELTLNKGYVAKWGVAEACRELIQNQLDSDSPFEYEFVNGDEYQDGSAGFVLRLRSEFSELKSSSLLLGTTSKADNDKAIGQFGEGYKIALLVLTRLGYNVRVLNGSKVWEPFFKYNSTFGEELLAIREYSNKGRHRGLTFEVAGLSVGDVEQIKQTCLKMQPDIGEVRTTPHGRILLDQPGLLYVGTLFVCKTELDFGYDVNPGNIRLERDRNTVADWDLRSIAKDMWVATEEFDRIAQMISDEVPDMSYFEYGSTELVRAACYKHFKERNPGKVIAKSQKEMDELVEQGMTVYVGGSAYHSNVTSCPDYKKEHKQFEVLARPPKALLEDFLRDNKQYMQRHAIVDMKALIAASSKWKLQ